jgi:gamma-glutamylcyclotransferase (GGCT)/AIG2-like uncharacterized protein YtfP
MNKHLVFVYGTLRKGESNDHYLNQANCIEKNCFIEGTLFDTNWGYPALLQTRGKVPVAGELYEVTEEELKELDLLEDYMENGNNNLYDRIIATIQTSNGEREAIVYVMNEAKEHFIPIKENDWVLYRKNRNK